MGDHHIDEVVLVKKRTAKHRFRTGILDSWGRCCAYCGDLAHTLDHVRPRARGGRTETWNLIAACQTCNRRKGSEDWLAWFREQEFWQWDRERRIQSWLSTQPSYNDAVRAS